LELAVRRSSRAQSQETVSLNRASPPSADWRPRAFLDSVAIDKHERLVEHAGSLSRVE
jgi:hypothetical protein